MTVLNPSSKEILIVEKKLSETERAKLIDNLVANSDVETANLWGEEDREALNAMDDMKIYRLAQQKQALIDQDAVVNAVRSEFGNESLHVYQMPTFLANAAKKFKGRSKDDVDDDETEPDEDDMDTENKEDDLFDLTKKKKVPVLNDFDLQRKRPMTEAEWLAAAPAGIRRAVENAQRHEQAERRDLINSMIETVEDDQKALLINTLRTKTVDELRVLSALATKKEPLIEDTSNKRPSYYGAAVPARNLRRAKEVVREDILSIPTINWKEDRAKELA
jgi:hypothetical protein